MSRHTDEFAALAESARTRDDYWVTRAWLDFTEQVCAKMCEMEMTKAKLAKNLGTSQAYVTKIMRGETNFTLETMVKIARRLGLELRVELADSAVERGVPSFTVDIRAGDAPAAEQLGSLGAKKRHPKPKHSRPQATS